MSVNYLQCWRYKWWYQLIMKSYGRSICRVVDKFSSSAKLGIYIPKFHWWFKYCILHAARAYFSRDLVFNVQKVSTVLNLAILYLGLHLRSHLLGCLLLKYTLSPILKEGGVLSMVFCVILKWFSSNAFLAMAKASLCASRFSIPESGYPKNHCMGQQLM